MSGRKGTGPQRSKRKSARYQPYGRLRTSERAGTVRSRTARLGDVPTGLVGESLGEVEVQAAGRVKSRTARLQDVPTGLVGELLGEVEVQESTPLPLPEGETTYQSEQFEQYSEDIQDEGRRQYDALSYETTKGIATADDLDLWTQPAAEFIRSGIGLIESSDEWVGKRPLGQGGFGLAGLWERLDADGTPVDVSGAKA